MPFQPSRLTICITIMVVTCATFLGDRMLAKWHRQANPPLTQATGTELSESRGLVTTAGQRIPAQALAALWLELAPGTSLASIRPYEEKSVASHSGMVRKNAFTLTPTKPSRWEKAGHLSSQEDEPKQDDVSQDDPVSQEGSEKQDDAIELSGELSGESSGEIPEPVEVAPQQLTEWETQFNADLEAWREITRRLLEIRSLYQNCTRAEADGYVLEWEQKQAKGNELVESLTATAFNLLKASPDDEDKRRFVTAMVARLFQEDRFTEVYEIGSFLMRYPDPHNMLYGQVGISAFALNDFILAKPLVAKAMTMENVDQRLQQYGPALERIQEFWEKELEYRQRDAEGKPLPVVKLHTTKGDILIELFENDAPQTVGNFVHLVEKGFYDGLFFHRVLPGFMAQTGCPLGTGTGGPGYTIPSECQDYDFRRHFGGVVSMANSGDPDSGGSQFFLTFAPAPHLDAAHTVFGRVIEGMDVLPNLQRIDPNDADVAAGNEPDQIINAEVISKRDHEYVPTKNEDKKKKRR